MRTYWYAYQKPDGSIWCSQCRDGSRRSMQRHIEYEGNSYIAGPCDSQEQLDREIARWKQTHTNSIASAMTT